MLHDPEPSGSPPKGTEEEGVPVARHMSYRFDETADKDEQKKMFASENAAPAVFVEPRRVTALPASPVSQESESRAAPKSSRRGPALAAG